MKSDSSPERDPAPDDDISRGQEAATDEGGKKRKRKPYRPGQWSGHRSLPVAGSAHSLRLLTPPLLTCCLSQVSGALWCASGGARPVLGGSSCAGWTRQTSHQATKVRG